MRFASIASMALGLVACAGSALAANAATQSVLASVNQIQTDIAIMGSSFQEFAAGTTDQNSSDAAYAAASNLVTTLQTAIYVVSQPDVKIQGSDVRKIVETLNVSASYIDEIVEALIANQDKITQAGLTDTVSQALPPIAQTYEAFFEAVVPVADPKYQPSLQAAADQINGDIAEAVAAFPASTSTTSSRRALGRVTRRSNRA